MAELAGFFHRADHRTRAIDGVGHHLFAVNVEPRLEALDRVRRVPEIRRRDDRRIEAFFRREHLVDVGIALRRVTLECAHLGDAALEIVIPDVANRLEMKPGYV
mgnify:CR=1 FL=1